MLDEILAPLNARQDSQAETMRRARGGGSEIALAVDMRFAAVGKAIFGHPEVAVGLVPGGGATQRLPRLIGRGRALEVLLGCNDLSAELAERHGYINRALPAEELTPFVETLAKRIASFPAHAIAHAKAAVDAGAFSSIAEGLLVEAHESDLSVASEVTQARVREALTVGVETYEGELVMDYLSKLSPITGALSEFTYLLSNSCSATFSFLSQHSATEVSTYDTLPPQKIKK
jgi:hypothetical protein